MKETLNVIKVGGGVVEEEQSLSSLLSQFAKLQGYKVLVHGGGRSATRVAAELGIESQMVQGRRVTDEKMLRVVTMVYGGLVNKTVVAGLQALGVNAVGLTGADMDIIRSHKRPLKKVTMEDGTDRMVDFGYVGDVDSANGDTLSQLIKMGVIPVVAPLTHDGNGQILNTNADTMASTVACALSSHFDVTLTFCFEKNGVLMNAEDDDSVIADINKNTFADLTAKGVIAGGMIPKLENAFHAIDKGVGKVVITSYKDIEGVHGTTVKG